MSDRGDEQRVHADGSRRHDAGEPSSADRVSQRTAALIAALMLAIGLLAGSILSDARESNPVEAPGSTVLSAVTTSSASAQTGTTASPPRASTRLPLTSLEVSEGASDVRGLIAIAPHPGASGGSPLWVLSPEGLVRRYEVPLWPGDYPYPLILSNGQVAFADLDNVYLVDDDLGSAPRAVSEGSYLLPSGSPDQIWIIGDGSAWVAPLDTSTGVVGQQIDVSDVVGWAEAGLESGLVVRPVNEAKFGRAAFWAPEAIIRTLALDDPDSRLLASSGTLAVFLSSDNTVQVLDVLGSVTVGRFSIDLGESVNVGGCISPDGASIAFYGPDIRDVVVSLASGEIVHELEPDEQREEIGWVTSDQLVVQTAAEEGRIVQVIDLATGTSSHIANLSGLGSWWITASGSNC